MSIVDLDRFISYVQAESSGADAIEAQSALDSAEAIVKQAAQCEFATPTTATRLYVPSDDVIVRIHDCHAITTVLDDGSAVSTADMQFEPVNQLSWTGEYRPYSQIRLTSGTWYRDGRKATVSVTGTFGWSEIPASVIQAVLLIGKDIWGARTTGVVDYSWVIERRADVLDRLQRDFRRVESWGIG